MALLSPAAVRLLERIGTSSRWTDAEALEVGPADTALLELRGEGLAEVQTWPPPTPGRRRHRTARAIDDRVERRIQVRLTGRGVLRLQRIRDGRRRRS